MSCFPFYHTMLLKLFASLSNALVALPCRKSMRTTVFSFHTADTHIPSACCASGTVQGGGCGAAETNDTPCVRMHQCLPGSTCLAFSSVVERLVYPFTVLPAALVLPYTSSMGMDSSMRSVISDSISFDLASVHQLLIFCQATLNRSGF